MQTQKSHEIINLVSVISTIFGFVLLLFFWSDLNIPKKILIFSFICIFLYIMLKNSYLKRKKYRKKYATIDSAIKKRSGPRGETLNGIQKFFNTLGQSDQPNFYQQNKNPWNMSLMYASQRIKRSESHQSQYCQYFNEPQQRKSEQFQDKTHIRLFIPQNLTSIFQEIKAKVSTNKHYMTFVEQIDNMKGGNINYSKTYLSNYYRLPSSLVLDKNKNLLLEKDYDIIIKDEEYCLQVISEFLQQKLEKVLERIQINFRRVSEMVMKIFGVKINFYGTKKKGGDFDSRDITITELREFLIRWRIDSCIPQKFKLSVPIKDFAQHYYPQITQLTQIVWRFLLNSERDNELAFRLYVQVLNQEFKDDKIQITENLSSLSESSRKLKHIFLIHNLGTDTSFSYNRIKKFTTSNPLIPIMAFFAENFRLNANKNYQVTNQLKKFFKEKPLI